MTEKLSNLAVTTTGVGGIELIQSLQFSPDVNSPETFKLILQIIVAVAGLVGLFKKKEKTT